jgi:sugar phosphate isomerase/epimerase
MLLRSSTLSRRSLLSLAAAAPLLRAAGKQIPIGLEMYSVRGRFEKDPEGSIRDVAKMGYQVVEIYTPYFSWPPEKLKQIRKVMDDLGVKCLSTHNSMAAFTPDGLQKAVDLNGILGSRYVVLASAGNIQTLDGWRQVADTLTKASEKLAPANLKPGYHNHQREFESMEGKRPMDVLAANTPPGVMLQLDVGHCVAGGADPVAWINANPGRSRSLHLKEWSPQREFKTLFGEGIVPWKKVFAAGENTGGAEFYLIEQEDAPDEFEAVRKCLEAYKKTHG